MKKIHNIRRSLVLIVFGIIATTSLFAWQNRALLQTKEDENVSPVGCGIVVANLNDGGAGSLRDAVVCSNVTPGTQTITFNAGVTGTITLTTGELVVSDSVNITGPGASVVSVSGNNASRIFNITAGNYNVAISGLTITNGLHRGADGSTGGNGFGGGILNDSTGTLSLTNSVLTANSAIGGDGNGPSARGGSGDGGAIFNRATGTVNIVGTMISSNIAKGGNAIGGSFASSISGNSSSGGIYNNSGVINIASSTLSNNSATVGDTQPMMGMGVSNAGFITGASGGAILNGNGGTVSVTDSTISGNSANGGVITFVGPIIYIVSGSEGGGIANGSGIAKIVNSTITGNSVNGGTLFNQPCPDNGMSQNSFGGGISSVGQLILTNDTIASNTATGVIRINGCVSSTGEGGGVINQFSLGTIVAKDTIIAGNTAEIGPDFRETLTSQGWNLIGNNKDATIVPMTGDQIGTNALPINPLLGPLANNGGPTMTLALLTGSPAIDKGAAATNPVTSLAIIDDQRGFVRPFDDMSIPNATGGNGSDIGAFEVQIPTTAAGVTVSGKALTSEGGRGIRNARITITDELGHTRSAITGTFGYYQFDDVEAGHIYVLSAMSKQFQFSPRVLAVFDNLADIDLVATL